MTQSINPDTKTDRWLDRVRVLAARRTEGRALALLVLVLVFSALFAPVAITAYGVTLGRVALIGLLALGLTVVILTGELDLSIASTLAVCGVIMASVPNVWLGILSALIAGIIIGLINAFFVIIVGINSFIATLGMLFALRGLAFILSDSKPVRLTNIDFGLSFGQKLLGPLTPRVLLFIVAFIVLHAFVTRVKSGREFYAVGGNRQAAVDAGIPVRRRITTGFVICGFVAALGGVINTLEQTASDPTAGSTLLLASFAAAIIGGVVLNGGRGSVVGTLIGALALGTLQVALLLFGVQSAIQDIFIGGVLLIAVITDPANLRAAFKSLRLSVKGSEKAQTSSVRAPAGKARSRIR